MNVSTHRLNSCSFAGRLCTHLRATSGVGSVCARPQHLFVVQAGRGFAELLSISKEPSNTRPKLKPYKVSPPLDVPSHIAKPPYAATGKLPEWVSEAQIQDAEGIERMRASGKLAAQVLQYAGTLVKAGVTTDAIDKAVHAMIIDNNAYPSPLRYGKFPKSVCTSVNECICHGIPDARPLQDGDIINVDVTVYLEGYHGDTSSMFFVGKPSPRARRLCKATKEALDAAIAKCGPGVPFKVIGAAIEEVAESYKYRSVRDFVGHGVGRVFHSFPSIFHFRNNEPGVMVAGMTFTIEPMLTEGTTRHKMWKDGWTVVTADGGLSAQYEHSLLITETGVEILTLP